MENSKFFNTYFHIKDLVFLLNQSNAFFYNFCSMKKAKIEIKEIFNIFSSNQTDSRVDAKS